MNQNFDDKPSFGQRFQSSTERDQQEIQDWLNGNGLVVIGVVVVFIALFAVWALVS